MYGVHITQMTFSFGGDENIFQAYRDYEYFSNIYVILCLIGNKVFSPWFFLNSVVLYSQNKIYTR